MQLSQLITLLALIYHTTAFISPMSKAQLLRLKSTNGDQNNNFPSAYVKSSLTQNAQNSSAPKEILQKSQKDLDDLLNNI